MRFDIAKARAALIGVAAFVLLGIVTMVYPFNVPLGTMLQGLFQAIPVGMAAVGLVLVYRSIRIINFLQIGLGAITATLFYEFYSRGILPFGIAIAVSILAGVLVSVIVGLILSFLFFKHPRLVLTIVTIFVGGLVTGLLLGPIVSAFQDPNEPPRPPQAIEGPWPDAELNISNLPFRTAHLVMFLLMVGTLVGLAIFFRKTRFGAAIRAAAENADRASLLGINVKMLQVGVWSIAGLLSAVASIGPTPVANTVQIQGDTGALLLPFAAAVVARMRSMPIAFFTAAGLLLFRQALLYETSLAALLTLVQFGIIMLGLLLQRKQLNTRVDGSTSWKAAKEIRGTPHEMLKVSTVRRTRYALMFLVALAILGIPWISSTTTINQFSGMWITAIIGISLVILTGWTGQMSLGQFAIVAVGAFVAGNVTTRMGLPFFLSLPLAGLAGALFAVLIGLPALRIRGLFLAITTLSISAIMPLLMFESGGLVTKWLPTAVERPRFLFLNFEDAKSMYYLIFVFFVLTVLSIQTLRKSRTGRVMIGMRDNEQGVQSFGIDVVRTRLIAFALSGFIAGFGGALKIALDLGMSVAAYNLDVSVQIFITVLIGGISTVMGAVLGAVYLVLGGLLFPQLLGLIQGVLGIVVLMFIPGGLSQMVFGMRDAVLRVIAMRQGIVVPSLFADYSPEAWEKRLAPLAPASQTQGLAALRHDQRYARPSKVLGEAPA